MVCTLTITVSRGKGYIYRKKLNIKAFHRLSAERFENAVYDDSIPAVKGLQIAGHPVVKTDELSTKDGFKFWLQDGSWQLVRFSGTEPLVRVYAEASSPELRDEILRAGEALVRGESTPA